MTLSPARAEKTHRQPRVIDSLTALGRMDNPAVISTSIPIALVVILLGFDKYQGPLPVPVTSLALGGAVFAATFIRPVRELMRPVWAVALILAIPIWMAFSTVINDVNGSKRVANIAMEAALVLVVSSGRICAVSISRGAGLAVLAGTAWGFATFSRSSYTGRLTGSWGDPNNAGMCLLVLGCIAFAYTRTRRARVLIGIATLAGLAGAFSRTSLFALAVVVLWVGLGERIPTWIRLAVVGATVWYVTTIPESEYTAGVFAGREGSDALRTRIDAATQTTVQLHPVYGNGAGTAQTTVQGQTFFFHNSYQALRAEGGWILLLIVMVLFALVFFALLRLPIEYRNRWIEGSMLAALICAINLGEVFLAPPVMLALGVAVRHIAVSRRRIRGVEEPLLSHRDKIGPVPATNTLSSVKV